MNKYLLEDYDKFMYEKNKFKLAKKDEYSSAIIIFSDNLIKIKNPNELEKFREKIRYFLITISQNCSNFNPNLFLKNYKKTVFEIKKDNKLTNQLGYVLIANPNIFHLNTFDVINHELLHLASIKKNIYDELFVAYEESYTQLLTERYFNEKIDGLFDLEVLILENIETIIGKDLMETKFFEGKLYSTINELYKYESKENINLMLLYLNKIYSLRGKSNLEHEFQDYINKIFAILLSCLKNKIKCSDNLEEVINLISKGKWTGTYSYKVFGNDTLYKVNLPDESIIEDLKQSFNYIEKKKKIINR